MKPKIIHDEDIPSHYRVKYGEDELYVGDIENLAILKEEIEIKLELESQKLMIENHECR